MSPRVIRWLVWLVCLIGIAGMIVGSIADNNGIAISFGIMTALAVTGLILVTAVAGPEAFDRRRQGTSGPPLDDATATDLEVRIQRLTDAGADEDDVRLLVTRALDAGRRSP